MQFSQLPPAVSKEDCNTYGPGEPIASHATLKKHDGTKEWATKVGKRESANVSFNVTITRPSRL